MAILCQKSVVSKDESQGEDKDFGHLHAFFPILCVSHNGLRRGEEQTSFDEGNPSDDGHDAAPILDPKIMEGHYRKTDEKRHESSNVEQRRIAHGIFIQTLVVLGTHKHADTNEEVHQAQRSCQKKRQIHSDWGRGYGHYR